MIPTEKPGTPEELAHYGVKGMKWGVRRQTRRQANADFKKKFSTAEARRTEIMRARASVARDKANVDFAPTLAARKAANQVYLNNPDRATALRLTRGEKVVTAILAGAVPPATIPIAVGVAARSQVRRNIQAQQARKK